MKEKEGCWDEDRKGHRERMKEKGDEEERAIENKGTEREE